MKVFEYTYRSLRLMGIMTLILGRKFWEIC